MAESAGLGLLALVLLDVVELGGEVGFLGLVLFAHGTLGGRDDDDDRRGEAKDDEADAEHEAHDAVSFIEGEIITAHCGGDVREDDEYNDPYDEQDPRRDADDVIFLLPVEAEISYDEECQGEEEAQAGDRRPEVARCELFDIDLSEYIVGAAREIHYRQLRECADIRGEKVQADGRFDRP